ncbi:MAG: hypothetical protein ACREHE_04645 [Rhizomicrobium sp.]
MRKLVVAIVALSLSGCGTFSFLSHPPRVFVVFFPDKSVTLTADAAKIVDDAAAAAKADGARQVQLTGPSTKIAPGYDPALAEPRIKLVENALVADGVAAERIVIASETTDGVNVKSDPSGAQRVEMRLIDKPAK